MSVLPPGYRMRELALDDAGALAAAYRRNREHLAPYEPHREESFFTARGQAAAVTTQLASVRARHLLSWVVVHEDDVVARVNLNNVVWGVLRSGSLGYWVDREHLRRGVASGAVEQACAEVAALGLHRLEAGTMLHNTASQRVLEGCGFEAYGVARRFLFLNGAWQDHRLYQRILHDHPL